MLGGFNPCREESKDILTYIKKELSNIEATNRNPPILIAAHITSEQQTEIERYTTFLTSSNKIENIDKLNEAFNNCYKYLLKIYNDETTYILTFKDARGAIIYNSKNPLNKFNLNYIALVYLSFLLEFHLFILTHKNIKDNTLEIKPTININTVTNQNENNLESIWLPITHTDLTTQHRIYKDRLTENLSIIGDGNIGIVNKIVNICSVINEGFNEFMNILIVNLTNDIYPEINGGRLSPQIANFPLLPLPLVVGAPERINYALSIQNIFRNIINEDVMKLMFCINAAGFPTDCTIPENQALCYEYMYDNWIDRIIQHILNLPINALKTNVEKIAIKNKCINLIYRNIRQTFDKFQNDYNNYITDATGFFSWIFLHDPDRATKYFSSCITYTYYEHYILHRIYVPPSYIKLSLQLKDSAGLPTHRFWYKTKDILIKERYKILNAEGNPVIARAETFGISHWATQISAPELPEPIKLRFIRFDPANPTNFFHRTVNLVDDKISYLKLLLYPIFDSYEIYWTKNKTNIQITYSAIKFLLYISNQIFFNIEKNINDLLIKLPLNIISEKINLSQEQKDKLFDYKNLVPKLEPNHNPLNIVNFNKETMYFYPNTEEISKSENLKNIITNFITKNFFSVVTTEKILNLIVTSFTNVIEEYIRTKDYFPIGAKPTDYIIFIIKGSNTLSLILKSYINKVPDGPKQLLLNQFNKLFSKSDMDFAIYIKNLAAKDTRPAQKKRDGTDITRAMMEQIYKDISDLSYLILNRIRNIILSNLEEYIYFYQLKKIEMSKLISTEILNKFNERDAAGIYINKDKFYVDNLCDFTSIEFDDLIISTPEDTTNYKKKIRKYDVYNNIGVNSNKNSRRDFFIEAQLDPNPAIEKIKKINASNIPFIHELKTDIVTDNIDYDIQKILYETISESNMYIYYNTSINKNRMNNYFNLLRIKFNFKAYYKIPTVFANNLEQYQTDMEAYFETNEIGPKPVYNPIARATLVLPIEYDLQSVNLGGEFIDISVQHYDFTDNYFTFDGITPNIGKDNDIDEYNFILHSMNNQLLKFYTYSYRYYYTDLLKTIHYNQSIEHILIAPWHVPKYQKRINRLFMLIAIDLLRTMKPLQRRKTAQLLEIDNINLIISNINNIINYITDINNIITKRDREPVIEEQIIINDLLLQIKDQIKDNINKKLKQSIANLKKSDSNIILSNYLDFYINFINKVVELYNKKLNNTLKINDDTNKYFKKETLNLDLPIYFAARDDLQKLKVHNDIMIKNLKLITHLYTEYKNINIYVYPDNITTIDTFLSGGKKKQL